MPQINVTGAYAYMAKDIGFDFNDLKGPVKEGVAGGLTALVQNGLIPADKIPTLQGLLNPMMDATGSSRCRIRASDSWEAR